jgi:hypothetical protein
MIKIFQHNETKEIIVLSELDINDDVSDLIDDGYVCIASKWENTPDDNHNYITLMEQNGHEEIEDFNMRKYIEDNY